MVNEKEYEKKYIDTYKKAHQMTNHIVQFKKGEKENIMHHISQDGIFFQKRAKSTIWHWMIHPKYFQNWKDEKKYTNVIAFEIPNRGLITVDKKYDKILKKIRYRFLK